MMPISTSVRRIFSQCRILGNGSQRITLNESEIFSLLHVSLRDLAWRSEDFGFPILPTPFPSMSYYQIPLDWFIAHEVFPSNSELLNYFAQMVKYDPDFGLYFHNLCSLHKRRLKYQRILSTQPKPNMDQIGPRSLLEYGITDTKFLFSWMVWRKWIFDIDNRSAQETGYLFEPVLASCLGGESISASKSPIKRLDENGNPTNNGRQIDCYLGDSDLAYELKLRVTIAASGQGRFAEEMSFPLECKAAKLTPVLLVLDPTPSSRLSELSEAFINSGGNVFIGDDAWEHMEQQAGAIMSVFLEKYIRPPLASVADLEEYEIESIHLSWSQDSILLETSNARYEISRHEGIV